MKNSNKASKTDDIFAQELPELAQFSFNQQVVDVFPDMINRSVPGYQDIVNGIAKLSAQLCPDNAKVYDLGCSLGSLSLGIAKELSQRNPKIIAIDNSKAMVDRCRQHIAAFSFGHTITVTQADLQTLSLDACDLVVTNFTLQFIPPEQRQIVLNRIFESLKPGGALIMSEKVTLKDPLLNAHLVDLHHQFKRDNGYSELEISQKRSALEKVMILDDIDTHKERLTIAGFIKHCVWFQHFNFLSMLAIKE